MLPVFIRPLGRIFGGGLGPVGPLFKRFRTSGRTVPTGVFVEDEADGPLSAPPGIEIPTTVDVGKRDLEVEAESLDCNRDAHDFLGGAAAGLGADASEAGAAGAGTASAVAAFGLSTFAPATATCVSVWTSEP